jgi:hypothetical protein
MIFRNIKNEIRNDPKKLVAVSNLFLAVGLMLPYLFHPSTHLLCNLTEGFRGLFIGFSICGNLWAVIRKKKMKEKGGCNSVSLQS